MMEALARQSGDLEALLAVKSRSLSFAYDFLQIAESCRKAGRADLAIEWAERGVRAFPSPHRQPPERVPGGRIPSRKAPR